MASPIVSIRMASRLRVVEGQKAAEQGRHRSVTAIPDVLAASPSEINPVRFAHRERPPANGVVTQPFPSTVYFFFTIAYTAVNGAGTPLIANATRRSRFS